jgi:hypothetical protein
MVKSLKDTKIIKKHILLKYNYSLTRNWTGNSNDNCHKKTYKDILTWTTQGCRWHVYIKIFNNFNWKYFFLSKYTNYKKLLGDTYISATKKKIGYVTKFHFSTFNVQESYFCLKTWLFRKSFWSLYFYKNYYLVFMIDNIFNQISILLLFIWVNHHVKM